MSVGSIELNGFEVFLSSPTFVVHVEEMRNDKFEELRVKVKDSWFLYEQAGKVYGLPRKRTPAIDFGTPVQLNCQEHLPLLAARIADVLPGTLPNFSIFLKRPAVFLDGKDIVRHVIKSRKNFSPLVNAFKIKPRYDIKAEVIALAEDDPFIGIFVTVRMHREVLASLTQLHEAGIDLRGLFAVLYTPEPEQKSLIGRIAHVSESTVELEEPFDTGGERYSFRTDLVTLEGSHASFARCLNTLLGSSYSAFEKERGREEAPYYTGPALNEILNKAGNTWQSTARLRWGADCPAR